MVLSDIFALFYEQNPNNPDLNKIHNDYINKREDFENKVKENVRKFAGFI